MAAPLDERCRCIHPNHKGMCPNKATHETKVGVPLCATCAEEHHFGKPPKEIKNGE